MQFSKQSNIWRFVKYERKNNSMFEKEAECHHLFAEKQKRRCFSNISEEHCMRLIRSHATVTRNHPFFPVLYSYFFNICRVVERMLLKRLTK